MGFTYNCLHVLKDCTMYDCACLQTKPRLHLQDVSMPSACLLSADVTVKIRDGELPENMFLNPHVIG